MSMAKVKKIENTSFQVSDDDFVRVKQCGNIIEVMSSHFPSRQQTQKLDKDNYLVISTGEIMQYEHTATRAENTVSIKKSMRNLRDIINTNCANISRCKFVTLTYRENMRDTEQLYTDIKKFFMRLRYFLKDKKFEYITVIEPQGRGAWHAHILLIFNQRAPFIANDNVCEIWGKGFTKITNIDSVDNLGAYLTAYLTDLDVEQASLQDLKDAKDIKEVEATDKNGNKVSKRVIKGGRLKYYPTGTRFYRCSRGVKRPQVIECSYRKAREIVGNAQLCFEKTSALTKNKNEVINIFKYQQYNKLRTNK